MGVYVVAQIRIRDRKAYGRYEVGFMAVFDQYGGEMLAVYEAPVTLGSMGSHKNGDHSLREQRRCPSMVRQRRVPEFGATPLGWVVR